MENTAPGGAASTTASGTHAILSTRTQDRIRSEQLQHDVERLQAELLQVRGERDRLHAQLEQALGQIAALVPRAPAPRATHDQALTLAAPAAEQSVSRILVSTYPTVASSEAERRRGERLGSEFEVEFLDDTHLISGLTQDISQGGLFVATYHAVPVGSQLSLAIELPSGQIEVRGEVRWTRAECEALEQRPGFGVAFTELSSEALAALTEFCRSHPPHYYDS